jgi:hypothetical protein
MTSLQTSFSTSLDTLAISGHRKKPYPRHICDREFAEIQCTKCGYRHKVRMGSRDRTCPACAREIYGRVYRKYENRLRILTSRI